MNNQPTAVTDTAEALEAATSGRWGIWLSDTGWWWAARAQTLTAAELAAGCLHFIHADSPDELAERIRQQDQLIVPSCFHASYLLPHLPGHPRASTGSALVPGRHPR